jgi:alpha-1,3-rhamnosyl/mannosyltransferase
LKLAILNITAGGMSGGYRKYLENLLPQISLNPTIEKILCALPSSVSLNMIPGSRQNIHFISIAPYHVANSISSSQIKVLLDRFQPDVVYVPVERLFSYENAPVVTMLQNMEPFICPFSGNPLTEKIKNYIRLRDARKALISADRIIAISSFVKDYLVNQLNINSQRIGLVYHGIGNPCSSLRRPATVPENCNEFVFTAGSIRPARGLEDILSAMAYLLAHSSKVPTLLIAGSADVVMRQYQRKLVKWIDKHNLSQKVFWIGDLDKSEMGWCYQTCAAFIMTSRVESFGQIALEALSYGCHCISANNPCLPEIFRDSALYYDPGDGKKLSENINIVFSWDHSMKKNISKKAIERSYEFSWNICAEKTVEEFRIAIDNFNHKSKGRQ